MLRYLFLFLLLSSMASGCVNSREPSQVEPNAPQVALDKLLDKLHPALVELASTAESRKLRLTSVTITLNTVLGSESQAKVGVLIVGTEHTRQETTTSEFKIKYENVKPGSVETSGHIENYVRALQALVESSNHQIASLGTSSITGTLQFAVARSAKGGAENTWEVVPVTLALSSKLTKAFTHKIEVVVTRDAN